MIFFLTKKYFLPLRLETIFSNFQVLENNSKLIDIENIIKTKNPSLYNKLPRFVLRLLKKIICQDQINRLLTLYGDLYGIDFIDAVFKDLNIKINCYGLEKLDKQTRYVFTANHPLGGIDGLAVIKSVNKNFKKATAVVNELLLNIDNLKPVFCGINVYGHASEKNANDIQQLFQSQDDICVFPAGLCSRKINGKIQDLPWKKNFIDKAVENNLAIVPIFVEAYNSNFFYNTAAIRKKIGIKFNYELILLPSEVFKFKNKEINLYFLEPILPETLRQIKNKQARAEFVRKKTYSAKQQE